MQTLPGAGRAQQRAQPVTPVLRSLGNYGDALRGIGFGFMRLSRMASVDIYPVAQPNAVQRLGAVTVLLGQQFRASTTVPRWQIPVCGSLWYHI